MSLRSDARVADKPGPISYGSAADAYRSVSARFASLSTSVKFAILACAVIGLGMSLLGLWVSARIENGVVQHTAGTLAIYTESVIESQKSEFTQPALSAKTIQELDAAFKKRFANKRIVGAKIWSPEGRILYSTWPEQIGLVYPISNELEAALRGDIAAELDNLEADENELERGLNKSMLEVYVPVRMAGGQRVVAVAEVYELADNLVRDIGIARFQSTIVFGALGLLMVLSLSGFVASASRTIAYQQASLLDRVQELSELLESNRELQKRVVEANRLSVETSEQVLNRVSAELHDGPAQLIGLALLRLDDSNEQRPDDLQGPMSVRTALQEAMREIRNISSGLALPELRKATVAEAIRLAVADHERRSGTDVVTDIGELPPKVGSQIVTCVYRFVQEALNNAVRHAGGVGQSVAADLCGSRLTVTVSDQGPGFNPGSRESGGSKLGLTGLRHRVEALDGDFSISSTIGQGARLTATFDLARPEIKNAA